MRCPKCGNHKPKMTSSRAMIAYRGRSYKCECGQYLTTSEFNTMGLCAQEAALIIRDFSKLTPEQRRGVLEGIR